MRPQSLSRAYDPASVITHSTPPPDPARYDGVGNHAGQSDVPIASNLVHTKTAFRNVILWNYLN